jgi:ribosomal protein S18 acetylase RimI-like enzyme
MFVKMSLPGATCAADVDRWMKVVLAPALWELAASVALREQENRARATATEGGVVREFDISDYETVFKLWKEGEGIVLRDADKRPAIARYLRRNPGMSFVYEVSGEVVAAVLCGTDGRRGFLHHLAVAPAHQRKGVGRALVARALQALAKADIDKCHAMVLPSNGVARQFRKSVGWVERTDVLLMSHTSLGRPGA